MSDPPIISVVPKGTPDHPRYVISDQRHRVWDGTGWNDDENAGLLFADERELGQVVRDLLLGQCGDKPTFVFTAPVQIEVRSNEPPDLIDLKLWLIRAARLYMDSRLGNGPLNGSVVLISINWLDLTMTEEEEA